MPDVQSSALGDMCWPSGTSIETILAQEPASKRKVSATRIGTILVLAWTSRVFDNGLQP